MGPIKREAKNNGTNQLITRQELADQLKVSIRSVDAELKKGLPCYRIGKSVRFDYADVLEYFRNKK